MDTLQQIQEAAKHQGGYVATYQVDVSRQMFSRHESKGRLERVLRGIYRVEAFPMSEHEDFIVAYLWSRERGVLSHETALAIHDLSDVLPKRVHLSYSPDEALPKGKPDWVRLHRAIVPDEDCQWYDAVPVTTPKRTLIDLAADGFDPSLFEQALDEAIERRLVPSDFDRTLLMELVTRRRDS
jgi:predicted transcriptional regulator of viral defense system